MDTGKTVYWIIGFATMTILGFLIIPPLMKKISNKLYKSSLKKDEIDFEDMGPEIVKIDNAKKDDTKEG